MPFVQNISPTFVKQPTNGKVQISSTDASAQKTIYTAGSNGSKITSLNAVSSSTAANDVQISIINGSTYPLGTVSVPAGAGNTSTSSSVNLLDITKITGLALDSDGNPELLLISGDILSASATTSVTSGKFITVIAAAVGDF